MSEEKRYFYAEINENNICHSLLDTPDIIEAENMIEIESYDTSLIGKIYTDGLWRDTEPVEEEVSETELIQAEMLLNQERIITKQNEHDEILAELLLGQQKGE